MKCVHTFGTGRHKRQADVTLLFEHMFGAHLNGSFEYPKHMF